ncbi:hypothetical protein WA171_006328 [Blastocystis sp. BT1]
MTQPYELPASAICEKSGMMYLHQEEKKNLKKFFCTVRGNQFTYESSQRDGTIEGSFNILGGAVRILDLKLLDKTGIELCIIPNVTNTTSMTPAEIKSNKDCLRYCFYVDSTEEANTWISILMRCTFPFSFLKESEYNGSEEHLRVASPFPKVKDMAPPYRRSLLWEKLQLCALHFDFKKESEAMRRDVKQSVLMELLDVVESLPDLVSDEYVFQEMIQSLELALFRPLPKEDESTLISSMDEDLIQYADPEWPHLSIEYEILLHIVLSQQIDSTIRKHFITSSFVTHLVSLFDSIDSREREYLKTITHRIYGKLTNRRASIRKAINHTFYEFLYETKSHRGISELLEILASIINGFTVPLRPEHKLSLERSLIPLHKMRQYEEYNMQLSYCMTLYISKDVTLSRPIITALLRYWPTGNSGKELMFLNELEDLLDGLQPADVRSYCETLCRRLAKCIDSSCSQVVERTLYLWNSPTFDSLFVKDSQNLSILAPLVYKPLRQCGDSSFNASLKQMSLHVIGILMDANMPLVEKLADEYLASSE